MLKYLCHLSSLACLCLAAVMHVQAEEEVAETYKAAGAINWANESESDIKIELTRKKVRSRYDAKITITSDDEDQVLTGSARGSVKSGTFKVEAASEDKVVELSINGRYRSGEFKGKIERVEGDAKVKGELTWKPTEAFAEKPKKSKSAAVKDYAIAGNYNWSAQGDRQHTVRAVFNGTGANTYEVKFYFQWGRDQRIYSGTAEGSLTNGALKGSVTADNQPNRKFGFEGTSTNGSFSGKHHEKHGTNEQPTGNITWKPE